MQPQYIPLRPPSTRRCRTLHRRCAALRKSALSPPLVASPRAVSFAVSERGLGWGNNADPRERLTADVHGAIGDSAWPIVGYTCARACNARHSRAHPIHTSPSYTSSIYSHGSALTLTLACP